MTNDEHARELTARMLALFFAWREQADFEVIPEADRMNDFALWLLQRD